MATDNFKSNLITWAKYFGVSSTVCCGLMHSGKSHILKYDNRLRSPEDGFQIRNDKIIKGWKAIHHHRTDQNPHQRWSDLQRKSAVHHPSDWGCDPFLSRASGGCSIRRNLYTFCWFRILPRFWAWFEPDLTRVCRIIWSSRLKSAVARVAADVLLRTAEPTVSQFFTRNQCYYP